MELACQLTCWWCEFATISYFLLVFLMPNLDREKTQSTNQQRRIATGHSFPSCSCVLLSKIFCHYHKVSLTQHAATQQVSSLLLSSLSSKHRHGTPGNSSNDFDQQSCQKLRTSSQLDKSCQSSTCGHSLSSRILCLHIDPPSLYSRKRATTHWPSPGPIPFSRQNP